MILRSTSGETGEKEKKGKREKGKGEREKGKGKKEKERGKRKKGKGKGRRKVKEKVKSEEVLSQSLLELVPSRSSFQLAGHMLDIVLSARTFPHHSWSHRILSLECLSSSSLGLDAVVLICICP